jgi:ABC-2 type transport system ATP-binding protein
MATVRGLKLLLNNQEPDLLLSQKILLVKDLKKVFGQTVAVDRISFEVNPGEIVGLLGPNGAGKTTAISMILGVLEPSMGNVWINGIDIAKDRSLALSQANFAAVYAPLPGNLTVYENLRIMGMLYGVDDLSTRISELLNRFDLDKFKDTKCGFLSSGEQTRVGLAKAMLNDPCLLLLDEPTASIDPSAAQDIRSRIKDMVLKDKTGALWASHNMYEVEEVCSRVLFLSHGKILLEGDPKTLPGRHNKKNLEELFISIAREPLEFK